MLGWRTRLSALAFLVAFTWIELIDATTYLNHYWFLTLLGALAVVAPLGRALSLDARRAGGPSTVAVGWVWLLRFQVGVVYVFAGLAKLQGDWLLRALPLELWLPARADVPVLGRLVGIEAVPHAFAVAGALFDCLVVPFLLWRRTRLAAWLALVVFHLCTWALFPIGVFPWLMVGAATVFFAPDWPRRILARTGGPTAVPRVRSGASVAGAAGPGRAVDRRPARPAAAAPRLPGRPPLDRPGLPLRMERAARREVGLGDVPRARPGDGPQLGGRPVPALHARTSSG